MKSISDSEKILLGLIAGFRENGCYMTNAAIGIRLHWVERKIQRVLDKLKDRGLIDYQSDGHNRKMYCKVNPVNSVGDNPDINDTPPVKIDTLTPTEVSPYPVNSVGEPRQKCHPEIKREEIRETPSDHLPGIEPPKKPSRKKNIPLPHPTWDEWYSYCKSIEWDDELDCSSAFNHYAANGWVQGKARAPIINWHAAARGCRDRSEQRNRQGVNR